MSTDSTELLPVVSETNTSRLLFFYALRDIKAHPKPTTFWRSTQYVELKLHWTKITHLISALYDSDNLHIPADFTPETKSKYSMDGKLEEPNRFSGLEIKIKTQPDRTSRASHTKPNKWERDHRHVFSGSSHYTQAFPLWYILLFAFDKVKRAWLCSVSTYSFRTVLKAV
jgi:hypothetical protein